MVDSRQRNKFYSTIQNLTNLGSWTLYFPLMFLFACGSPQRGVWIEKAPSNSSQLGILIDEADSNKVNSLILQKKINARVISKSTGTYEIYGMSAQELRMEFPDSLISKNHFITTGDEVSPLSSRKKLSKEDFYKHFKILDMEKAWIYSKGEGVTIAVLDTGLNFYHKDFENKIEVSLAWNFGEGNNDLSDPSNHGTSVAGIIVSDLVGIAPRAKILPLKVIGSDNLIDEGTVIAALKYVKLTKASIVNMSIGKSSVSPIFIKTLNELEKANVLIVAATGNNGMPCTMAPIYPASSQLPNTISVGASLLDLSHPLELASYSNFGKCVEVVAPAGDFDLGIPTPNGHQISSSDEYILFSGTSASAPLVSGLAAIIKSLEPELSPAIIKEIILKSSRPLNNKNLSAYGLINAEQAIKSMK